jgi:uncharacterized protein (DUF1501 family)
MLSRRALLTLLAASGTAACGSRPGETAAPTAAPQAAASGGATTSGVTSTTATGGATTAVGGSSSAASASPHTLVVVFQRFAADWLNLLVPYGDPDYAALRPNIKVGSPLDLDGYFGLNPGLADLKPLYDSGRLGFVAATGWLPQEARDRSHFFAQSIAEAGARSGAYGGWLARVMLRDSDHSTWAALAAENAVPASFQGYAGAIAVRNFADYRHGSVMGDAATALIETIAGLAGTPGERIRQLAEGMRLLQASPPPEPTLSYPATSLGQGLKVAAQAIRGGLAPRVISVSSEDDWDTHVNQVSRHAAALPNFAGALRAFHDDLGALMDGVSLVTMTEFGRKARENLGGTDHGTASSMLLMGGGIAGGQVYGQWPGLSASALYQGEDLEPTTDFRSVLGELLAGRMGLGTELLEEVFPGGYAAPAHWRGFLR